eukprot:NODE_379_length_1617_cov_759.681178.p1 GENE.NODE_379_length_1617_cov_759.681178~~NODE_379_length_1617_cov_759.681178.p1  ORF type:complete len:394 (-),score=85.12 NODE_379_length_1617_cov_759.681178:403-1509(-)
MVVLCASPLARLTVAAAGGVLPWRPARASALLLVAYTIYDVYVWWTRFRITLNGIVYKEDARVLWLASTAPRAACRSPRGSGGGCMPALGAAREFCFAPGSLPYGEPPGMPNVMRWSNCDASLFQIRSADYLRTKAKVPSSMALFECVGMDMIHDCHRIDGITEHWQGLPSSAPDAPPWDVEWGVPRVIAVNAQLPLKSGTAWFAHPEDDGGLSVVVTFVLSAESCGLLAAGTLTPALRLLKRFTEQAGNPKGRVAIKAVGRVEDPERYEVPTYCYRFNNKPVLLTKSLKVITGMLPEVLEIDFDVRTWVFLAKSALANYHYYAREAEFEVGFVLEGRADDDLPEQMLGCVTLANVDILASHQILPQN